MTRIFLIVCSLATAILISCILIGAAAGINLGVFLILLWDLLPLILVALSAFNVRPGRSPVDVQLAALRTFGFVALGITAWEYLDILYYFMTASHTSSTTALAFVVYPIIAIVPAIVSAMLAMLIAFVIKRYAHV